MSNVTWKNILRVFCENVSRIKEQVKKVGFVGEVSGGLFKEQGIWISFGPNPYDPENPENNGTVLRILPYGENGIHYIIVVPQGPWSAKIEHDPNSRRLLHTLVQHLKS